jgi:hypothetical protein
MIAYFISSTVNKLLKSSMLQVFESFFLELLYVVVENSLQLFCDRYDVDVAFITKFMFLI